MDFFANNNPNELAASSFCTGGREAPSLSRLRTATGYELLIVLLPMTHMDHPNVFPAMSPSLHHCSLAQASTTCPVWPTPYSYSLLKPPLPATSPICNLPINLKKLSTTDCICLSILTPHPFPSHTLSANHSTACNVFLWRGKDTCIIDWFETHYITDAWPRTSGTSPLPTMHWGYRQVSLTEWPHPFGLQIKQLP